MLSKLSCCSSFPTSGAVSTASSVQLRTPRLRGVYMAQTCHLSTQEAEAGGLLWVPGQLGLWYESLMLRKKRKESKTQKKTDE